MFYHIIESLAFDRTVSGVIRCCTGFMGNDTIGDCICTKACPLGYVGLQCEIPCVYPLYGQECQSVCNWPREFCLISTGCIERFTSAEYYKTGEQSERHTDSTTLVTNDKSTTVSSNSFSSNVYHTSERNLLTESNNLSPKSNQDSFPSVIILVSMGCLILIIFFLTLPVYSLYRKQRRLREYVEENRYYLSCALKHTNDSKNKTLSDIDNGEIKIALTIFQNKKESVIHLEPHSVSQLSNQNVSHYSYVLPTRINPENHGSRVSLNSMESGAYVIPTNICSSKSESGHGGESNVYLTVLND